MALSKTFRKKRKYKHSNKHSNNNRTSKKTYKKTYKKRRTMKGGNVYHRAMRLAGPKVTGVVTDVFKGEALSQLSNILPTKLVDVAKKRAEEPEFQSQLAQIARDAKGVALKVAPSIIKMLKSSIDALEVTIRAEDIKEKAAEKLVTEEQQNISKMEYELEVVKEQAANIKADDEKERLAEEQERLEVEKAKKKEAEALALRDSTLSSSIDDLTKQVQQAREEKQKALQKVKDAKAAKQKAKEEAQALKEKLVKEENAEQKPQPPIQTRYDIGVKAVLPDEFIKNKFTPSFI